MEFNIIVSECVKLLLVVAGAGVVVAVGVVIGIVGVRSYPLAPAISNIIQDLRSLIDCCL